MSEVKRRAELNELLLRAMHGPHGPPSPISPNGRIHHRRLLFIAGTNYFVMLQPRGTSLCQLAQYPELNICP